MLIKIYNILRFKGPKYLVILILVKLKLVNKLYLFSDYKQYSLDFSPVSLGAIKMFIKKNKISNKDLLVVPRKYLLNLNGKYSFDIISANYLDVEKLDLGSYKRLFWATSEVDKGCNIAKYFYKNRKKVIVLENFGPARSIMHDEIKFFVMKEEFQKQTEEGIEKFSHGIGSDFMNLLQSIDNTKKLNGDYVEIGCFMGSSTCVMASYLDKLDVKKNFYVYDTFDGFNYDKAKDSIDSKWMSTNHKTDGLLKVKERVTNRHRDNIKFNFIKRDITIKNSLREVKKISFANIDVDLYEAVKSALIEVNKKIVRGGHIIIEDAGHTPFLLGAKLALQEFLDEYGNDLYISIQMDSGQYLLIRR